MAHLPSMALVHCPPLRPPPPTLGIYFCSLVRIYFFMLLSALVQHCCLCLFRTVSLHKLPSDRDCSHDCCIQVLELGAAGPMGLSPSVHQAVRIQPMIGRGPFVPPCLDGGENASDGFNTGPNGNKNRSNGPTGFGGGNGRVSGGTAGVSTGCVECLAGDDSEGHCRHHAFCNSHAAPPASSQGERWSIHGRRFERSECHEISENLGFDRQGSRLAWQGNERTEASLGSWFGRDRPNEAVEEESGIEKAHTRAGEGVHREAAALLTVGRDEWKEARTAEGRM